jgi:hypothetical protein
MRARRQIRSEILILLLLLAATGLAYALHWSFTVDDAAISFSYARNFAHSYGLGALYPGAPRVEGYSNLLWVILLAAGTRLGVDTLLVSKILGLIFTLGAVMLLYLSLREFIRHRWLLLGLALLPVSLTFTFWSVSGLENALYAFLILLSVYFLLREDKFPAQIPLGSALSLVLVGITRPEGLVYALAGLGFKIVQLAIRWRQIENRRLLVKNLLSWLAIFLLGYGLFKTWHYAYFAAWWPNPIYAKAGWYQTDLKKIWFEPGGWTYLRGYFRTFAAVGIIPALLFGGLVSLKGPQRIFPISALASLVLPLYTFDWMLNYRFLYPFVPFAVALLLLAADQLWTWLSGTFNVESSRLNVKRLTFVAALVLTVWFGLAVARFAWANLRLTERQLACGYTPMAETRCLDGKMYWSMGEVNQKYSELQSYAAKIGLIDPLYMIPDIGATSYLQNKRILDLAGLADYQLARIREGSLLKQYIFQEQRPDFIMTYGVWTRRTDLTTFNAFRENYLPIEQGTDANGLTHGTFVRKDLIVQSEGVTASTEMPDLIKMAPGLSLSHIQTAHGEYPGQELAFNLIWLVDSPQVFDWNQHVRLVNQAGEVVYESIDPLGYGWYPTSHWQTGEEIRQHLAIPSNVPEGDYTMEITLSVDPNQDNPVEDKPVPVPTFNFPVSINSVDDNQDQQAGLQSNWMSTSTSENGQLSDLAAAQTSWQAREIEAMLLAIRQAADVRGRAQAIPEWRKFSKELLTAADLARQEARWSEAYPLYLGAVLSDPDNVWAQHGLEQARRKFILGAQGSMPPEQESSAVENNLRVEGYSI